MRNRIMLAAIGTGVIGLVACPSAAPVDGNVAPRSSVSSGGEAAWTARIESVSQFRFNAADSTRDKSYGSAEWRRGADPAVSTVKLSFSFAGPERMLHWAILFGNCGNATLPLLPVSSFPELEVAGGGRAHVDATLGLQLPASGTYHIEIYRHSQGGPESVVGCGNLKRVSG